MTNDLSFIANIKPLFRAKRVPPFSVLKSILLSGKIDMGMSGCYEWSPVEIDKDDYLKVCAITGLKEVEGDVPKWVTNFENWDIYQYELTHNLPSEEYFRLVEKERELIAEKLDLESKDGVDNELAECLINLMDISEEISEFQMKYFKR